MKRRITALALAVLWVLALAGAALAAQWANPELLLSPQELKAKLGQPNWVVVDCRDLKHYVKGHIPGAISLGKRCKKALRDATSRVFRDVSRYEKLLGKVGIGNDTHVVFYGQLKTKTMEDASVGFWILEYLGHDKVHYLNGGLDAWIKAGYKLERKPVRLKPKVFKAKVVPSRYASTDEIVRIARGQLKGVQLIDSRTRKEHLGQDIRAIRGGHIPNTTINVSHIKTFDQKKDPKTGKDKPTGWLSPERVSKLFASLDKNKRTIAYCQTGTRSTLTYLQLRLLGFKDPANWDESWSVYGNHYGDFPVANEQWMNFARIKKLEGKVKKLEKKLKKLEKAARKR